MCLYRPVTAALRHQEAKAPGGGSAARRGQRPLGPLQPLEEVSHIPDRVRSTMYHLRIAYDAKGFCFGALAICRQCILRFGFVLLLKEFTLRLAPHTAITQHEGVNIQAPPPAPRPMHSTAPQCLPCRSPVFEQPCVHEVLGHQPGMRLPQSIMVNLQLLQGPLHVDQLAPQSTCFGIRLLALLGQWAVERGSSEAGDLLQGGKGESMCVALR